jgi:hypothetical protein
MLPKSYVLSPGWDLAVGGHTLMTESSLKTFLDAATLVILTLTLAAVMWQGYLIRRTLTADTFVQIVERAEQIKLSETMDMIDLWSFTEYATYLDRVPIQQQIQLRAVIDFFNDLSHLARSNYVDDYYPVRLYFPSLTTCNRKLLPWWAEGIRTARSNPYLYNNFQVLCEYAQAWEDGGFRKIRYRKYLRERGIVEL